MTEFRYYVRGEIDIATAPELRADLQRAIDAGHSHLLVDCTFLTFIDSTGIAALLEVDRELTAQGRRMLVVNLPSGPRRALEVLGLDHLSRWDRQYTI